MVTTLQIIMKKQSMMWSPDGGSQGKTLVLKKKFAYRLQKINYMFEIAQKITENVAFSV